MSRSDGEITKKHKSINWINMKPLI